LAFLQAAEAARLNRREMHEDVFAILTADETKPFSVVKTTLLFLFPNDSESCELAEET